MRQLLAILVLITPVCASALSFGFEVELDGPTGGNFATLSITEHDGALDFEIALAIDSDLGDEADLHAFYFNLIGDFGALEIESTDPHHPKSPYTLRSEPSVLGGAGSSFDYGVLFGNGAGPRGNGTLQYASFTISADQPLSIEDLFELSTAQGGEVEIFFAAHFQSTDFGYGSDSETVGVVIVPEPATGALLACGLSVLAVSGNRRTHKA